MIKRFAAVSFVLSLQSVSLAGAGMIAQSGARGVSPVGPMPMTAACLRRPTAPSASMALPSMPGALRPAVATAGQSTPAVASPAQMSATVSNYQTVMNTAVESGQAASTLNRAFDVSMSPSARAETSGSFSDAPSLSRASSRAMPLLRSVPQARRTRGFMTPAAMLVLASIGGSILATSGIIGAAIGVTLGGLVGFGGYQASRDAARFKPLLAAYFIGVGVLLGAVVLGLVGGLVGAVILGLSR